MHSRAAVWIPEWPCRGSTIQPPGARPGHLLPRGGRNPGASSLPLVGRGTSQELAGHQQSKQAGPGGGKRVEWAERRLFWPHWSCLLLPYYTTMTYHNILYHTMPAPTIPYHTIPALAAALGVGGKNCRQMGISLGTNTNAAVPSNFHIMVEGCRGTATGLNLFRKRADVRVFLLTGSLSSLCHKICTGSSGLPV